MIIEIISIGDELLLGQTINTNASFIAKGLSAVGHNVDWITTVGDNADHLKSALSIAIQRSDVVIATGGLGPTHDDITKKVAADYFQSDCIFHPDILERLEQAFAARGIKMADVNRQQAYLPEKAKIIENPVGTAQALLFEQNNKKCFVLPGVPFEMRTICENSVFPMLSDSGISHLQKTIKTTGIAESILFEKITNLSEIEKLAKVAFLPKPTGVEIRLNVSTENENLSKKNLNQALELLESNINKYIYGYDDETIEETVASLLIQSGKTIAVAESCTGGLLANKLTNISGSSAYFDRGIVTYSNQAKIQQLNVPEEIINTKGAVSAETAEAMAKGIRKIAGTHFGLSTTGIAGPTGGTPEKPVGLVFIGLANENQVTSKRFVFTKDRLENKERTVQAALNLLKKELTEN